MTRKSKKEVEATQPYWKDALAEIKNLSIPRKEDTREIVERATLAERDVADKAVNLEDIADMTRTQVLNRKADKARYEATAIHVRRVGSRKWERGFCRRFGIKTMVFIPVAKNGGVETEEVVGLDDVEIINDYEWQLQVAYVQIETAQKNIEKAKKDVDRLGAAYRRFLTTRRIDKKGGEARASPRNPTQGVTKEVASKARRAAKPKN